jgi:signal transduction histidine kinase
MSITAVGVGLSAAAWSRLLDSRRAELDAVTRSVAAESREAIQLRVERQLEAVEQLAAFWMRFGPRDFAEWEASASLFMHTNPGVTRVAWLGIGSDPLRAGVEPSAEEMGRDEADAKTLRSLPRMVGPERDAAGIPAYRLLHPVLDEDGRKGALVASIRTPALLGRLLTGAAPGYAISVAWDGEEIYARDVPTERTDLDWWRAEEEVPFSIGTAWQLVHAPTPALVARTLTVTPHLFFGAGVLFSTALGLLAHQLGVARQRTRSLEEANRSLDVHLDALRESEAASRRLRAELEARVQARTQELREAMAELEAFNYSVSHDLRSPLSAILNFVALLEESRGLAPTARAMVLRIGHSAERASALLDGLLQLSRAGRAQLELEGLDMQALAREVYAQVRAARGDHDIELFVDPLPPAHGDRALIADVFANLFDNALKYSQGRHPRSIRVGARQEDEEFVYAVADDGIGFDARFGERIFGLFERLHPSDEFTGTGVGLAIVARIVRRHGGRVWAESEPGRGACFFFSLPRHRTAA